MALGKVGPDPLAPAGRQRLACISLAGVGNREIGDGNWEIGEIGDRRDVSAFWENDHRESELFFECQYRLYSISHSIPRIKYQRTSRLSPSFRSCLDDQSLDTYNGGDCGGSTAPWVYTGSGNDGVHPGQTPIHWSPNADQSLANIYGRRKQ